MYTNPRLQARRIVTACARTEQINGLWYAHPRGSYSNVWADGPTEARALMNLADALEARIQIEGRYR